MITKKEKDPNQKDEIAFSSSPVSANLLSSNVTFFLLIKLLVCFQLFSLVFFSFFGLRIMMIDDDEEDDDDDNDDDDDHDHAHDHDDGNNNNNNNN